MPNMTEDRNYVNLPETFGKTREITKNEHIFGGF
jgi:hypothetical protein